MIMFLLSLLYALTMNLKTKKVSEYVFWNLQIVLIELYSHYWWWNKNGVEVDYNIWLARRSGRLGMLRGQSHTKKQIVYLKKLEQTQRIRREGLEKVTYDPKSIEKFGYILE